jgi:hypothetical protein
MGLDKWVYSWKQCKQQVLVVMALHQDYYIVVMFNLMILEADFRRKKCSD